MWINYMQIIFIRRILTVIRNNMKSEIFTADQVSKDKNDFRRSSPGFPFVFQANFVNKKLFLMFCLLK